MLSKRHDGKQRSMCPKESQKIKNKVKVIGTSLKKRQLDYKSEEIGTGKPLPIALTSSTI